MPPVTAPRTAVVAGGTGLIGTTLLQLLSDDRNYHRVTSLVRREVPVPAGITTQLVDFEQLERTVLPEVDDAFCCLGTTRKTAGSDAAFRRVDFDYIVAFAHLAKSAGARRFLLVSSVGASPSAAALYLRTKGECEDAIKAIGFATVVILRPSFLMGNRTEARAGEGVAIAVGRVIGPLLIGPLRRYAPVESSAVARTLVEVAAMALPGITVIESDRIR